MSEFYIVLSNDPPRYETLEEAQGVLLLLRHNVPDSEHRVFRCKSYLAGAKHFTKLVALVTDILADEGLTPESRDRARILLGTIGTRTPRLQTLTRRPGPPEYQPPSRGRAGP